jgi:hypothetical protein
MKNNKIVTKTLYIIGSIVLTATWMFGFMAAVRYFVQI